MRIRLKNRPRQFLLITLITGMIFCQYSCKEAGAISGTIYFENGSSLDFVDIVSIIFAQKENSKSVPRHVTEWTKHYGGISMSSSIPLAWLKSIEILSFDRKEGYLCMFNPVVSITNVHGVTFESQYDRLEWMKVKIKNRFPDEIYIYFADNKDSIMLADSIGDYDISLDNSRSNIKRINFDH